MEDVRRVLPVHPWVEGERYFLGIFLNGAYQEILGDLHNLFGDTNAVHVHIDGEGGYEVAHVVKGDTTSEVLQYVEHTPGGMVERVRRQAERARRQGLITFDQVKLLMKHYEESLGSYTYLTHDD